MAALLYNRFVTLAVLPWIVLTLVLVALAALILLRQMASPVARLFSAMISLVAIWFAAVVVLLAGDDVRIAHAAARIGLAAVAFMPAAVYHFSATALRLGDRRASLVAAIWFVAGVFGLLILTSDLVTRRLIHYSWGYFPSLRTAGGAALVVFVAAVFAAHFREYVAEMRRTKDADRRRRLRDLVINFAIVSVTMIDFLPMFGVSQRPVGYLPVTAFLLYAWRSIRRHRLNPISTARAAREIVETMADALFVLDDEARIRSVNPAVKKLVGYSEEEIVGKAIDVLEAVNPDETISRTLRDMVRRGTVRDQERLFRHKDGSLIEVSISVSSVREGEVEEGAVVIVRDIRERKRAEEELHAYARKLQQSNRDLEDFAYVASHDLQEPLRKIQAFGDRLRTKCGPSLPPEGVDYLERMQSAARRMQTLINDLLSFSRVTTKAQPFVSVELWQIAHEVVKDLEARLHDTEGTVTIGPLPVIDADPVQMRHLLQNLIGNALKFHRPGVAPQVDIRGSVVAPPSVAQPDGVCEIIVGDNGIGFDQKYADRIFTMFERLHGRTEYEGTGIGLAICRKIAQRHGGDITARSSPGEGSSFIVTLPLRQRHQETFDAA